MVHKSDLVIIGICVGLALGILIATLVFFGLRWYKKHDHLRRCSNERSVATHPIRINGLGTSIDFSAPVVNSVAVKASGFPQKKSRVSWWSNHSKDRFTSARFTSASGIPRYAYK